MRRMVGAPVPQAVRDSGLNAGSHGWWTPLQWRLLIREGMRYRRRRRFAAEYVYRDRGGHVVAVEENEWLDLGGEGGGGA